MSTRSRSTLVAGAAAALLAACGGGGGSDTPTPPPQASSITIAGVAAKGAALPGAAISAKCATGSGTATADASGAYSLTIASGALPCALRAQATEGTTTTTFHSLLAGSGTTGSFTAHITPLTELVVARAAAAVPGTFFDAFSGANAPSAAAVTQAIEAVRTMAAGLVDLSGVNPISDPLVAAAGSAAGNALDQKIDTLMAALARAQIALADVSAAVAENPSVPAVIQTALKPVAEDCSWLRSGRYRMINPNETDPAWRTHVLEVDAAAKRIKLFDNSTADYTSDGGCGYSINDGTTLDRIMVSSGGLVVVFSQELATPTNRWITVGLPEQTLPLAEFAGTWHLAGWDPASGATTPGFVAQTGEATIDDQGRITALSGCVGTAACIADTGPFPTLAVHAQGGFTISEGGTAIGRVFLYKALSGRKVLVMLTDDGQFIVGVPKAAIGAPTAPGTVSSIRQFQLNGNGSILPLSEQTYTFLSVDQATNSATRQRMSDGLIDTLRYDHPRPGLRYRAPNSCSLNNAAANCAEIVQLPLQGMGIVLSLSVGTTPTNAFFNVSVIKPAS